MADAYVDSNINSAGQVTKLLDPLAGGGGKVLILRTSFELAASDAAADIKRIFRAVPSNLIPIGCKIGSDGIAGATDIDLGLYQVGINGAAADVDLFGDGLDLSQAHPLVSSGERWTQEFNVRDADETAADSTTFKKLIAPGRPAKVVGLFAITETAPTVGTDVIEFKRGSSAGNTLLNAANANANSLTANQVSQYTLTSTAADLIINGSGANSAVYAAYVAGAQTVDAVGMTLGVIFESMVRGLRELDIADCNKTLWELLGLAQTAQKSAYDIAMTLNSEVTAAGTVSIEMMFAQGV